MCGGHCAREGTFSLYAFLLNALLPEIDVFLPAAITHDMLKLETLNLVWR